MCIGIFSFRAFDRRLARLAAPISSGVRQGGRICPPPPAGRVRLNTPAGRGLRSNIFNKVYIRELEILTLAIECDRQKSDRMIDVEKIGGLKISIRDLKGQIFLIRYILGNSRF